MAHNDIVSSIKKLAAEKNTIILSHYYQEPEIQDLAHFVGDSLELSRAASTTDAEIILFCGVYFMAEVAKVLNPTKTVLIPDPSASCSLADSCSANGFSAFRKKYPNYTSVTYINSSLEVKAMSDIICTSSNAEFIIRNVSGGKPVLFAPDKYLGGYLQKKTGIEMIMWQGTCIVHESFSEKELLSILSNHPYALVIAHPECPEALLNHADFVGSTSQLINYAAENNGRAFIVLTEEGILHKMKSVSPNSQFHVLKEANNSSGCSMCSKCPYMRLNTLEKIHDCLLNNKHVVEVDPTLMRLAKIPIDKMMELSNIMKKQQC